MDHVRSGVFCAVTGDGDYGFWEIMEAMLQDHGTVEEVARLIWEPQQGSKYPLHGVPVEDVRAALVYCMTHPE